MKPKIVASFLSEHQEFQLLQARDARAAAERNGFEIQVLFADLNTIEQIHQLFGSIHAPEAERPAAIVVETVVGEGLQRVARNAVQAGIGWILLNRRVPYLGELRAAHPGLPIAAVGTDQLEVGRIQGRQFRTLLPKGGNVLYLQGPPDTSAAQERLAGMEQAIRGAAITVKALSAHWTEASGEKAVRGWLRLRSSEFARLDLVGSQNDAMAVGARRALQSQAAHWAAVPFTGVDGLPDGGQRLVREGVLAATVVTPSNAGPAIDLVAKTLRTRQPPPAEVLLPPVSYPDEPELGQRTAAQRA